MLGKKRIPESVLAGLTTLFVFFLVLAVKRIFPFGEYRIDYYDMGQEYAPVYYHIWDFLHGKSGLFYNWYLEQGQNFVICRSLLSVFNLFFLFIPRHLVLQSLSLFLGIHLFFMTFNMDLFMRRIVPSEKQYRYILSIAYGLCGYTLTHYTVPPFMDVAALAPIYLLSLANLLKKKRTTLVVERLQVSSIIPFAVMTGYMTFLSYYLAFMNLLFILLISGTYIYMFCPIEERKPVAFRLCIGTISGLLLSSWILIPTGLQLMETTRLKENTKTGITESIMVILRAIGADMYYIKWWQLSGSIVAIVAIIVGIVRYRNDRRMSVFIALICFYPCALIPLESINLLFHLGVYYQYPVRCGYWIPLILLSAGAYYLSRISSEQNKRGNGKSNTFITILAVCLSVSACIALILFYKNHEVWDIHELFRAWIVFAVIVAAIYAVIILTTGNPRYLMLVLGVELVCGAYIGYGQPHFHDEYSSQPEQSGDFIIESQKLADDLGIVESRIDRIKNPDTALNANYGMVIRRASVGGNYEGVTEGQRENAGLLGYSIHFIRILDSGGTIFTDALLHVTQMLTCEPFLCENDAYHLVKENRGFGLYDSVYIFPFAIAVTSDALKDAWPTDVLKVHNLLYESISGKKGAVMSETKGENIRVEGRKALYISGSSADEVTVNGQVIPVPSIGELENTAYPAEFNCNLIFAGIYENETVKIDGMEDLEVYILDLSAIENLSTMLNKENTSVEADRNGLKIDIEGSRGKDMMLIPVCYDKGFRATVNGKKSDVYNIGDMFMAVPIEEGMNHIELRFIPRGLILGVSVSVLVFTILILIEKKPIGHSTLDNVSYIAFSGIWYTALAILYVIPIIAFIIHQIVKRLPMLH